MHTRLFKELRFRKWVIRKLVESRIASGVGIPRFAATWFQTWEDGASGIPCIPNPWGYFVTTAITTPQVDPIAYVPDLFSYQEKGDLTGVYVIRQGAAFRGTESAVQAITGAGGRPGITMPAATSANLPKVPTPGTVLAEVAAAGSPVQTPGTWIVDATRRYLLDAAALAKLGNPTPVSVPGGGLAQIPSGGSPYWLGGLVVADSQPSLVHEWDPTPQVEGTRSKTAVLLWNNGATARTTTVTDLQITTPADTPGQRVFTVDTPLPLQVAQNQLVGVDVTFDARVRMPGPLAGLVTVICDDPIAPELRIPLATSVTPLGDHAQITVSPGSLDLGAALVSTTADGHVQVTNAGARQASIAAAIIDEQPVPGQFGVSTFPSLPPLPAGATMNLQVTYEPTARGAASGTLAIDMASDTSLGRTYHQHVDVPLTGTATAPVIYLVAGLKGMGRHLLPELTALDFGAAAPGTLVAKSFFIVNVGDAPLTVSGIAVANQSSFGVSNPAMFPVTLAPGGEVEVPCNFNPGSVAGVPSGGELKIYSNDPARPAASLRLAGRAAGPHLRTPGELLDLQNVTSGQLVYTSDGSVPVRIKSAKLASGQDFSISTAPALPALVNPGDAFVVTVAVTAPVPGMYQDQLELVHDGAPNGSSAATIRAEES